MHQTMPVAQLVATPEAMDSSNLEGSTELLVNEDCSVSTDTYAFTPIQLEQEAFENSKIISSRQDIIAIDNTVSMSYSGYMGDINVLKKWCKEFPTRPTKWKKDHTHAKIDERMLTLKGHDTMDLADLIKTTCKLELADLPPPMVQSFAELKKSLQFYRGDYRYNLKYSAHISKAFVRQFDQCFFFGRMESRIKLSIAEVIYKDLTGYERDQGRKCKIYILPVSRYRARTDFLRTILHEMIHAFLGMFSCHFQSCASRQEAEGPDGHEDAFCRVAIAIESAIQRHTGLRMATHWEPCSELDLKDKLQKYLNNFYLESRLDIDSQCDQAQQRYIFKHTGRLWKRLRKNKMFRFRDTSEFMSTSQRVRRRLSYITAGKETVWDICKIDFSLDFDGSWKPRPKEI